MKKLITTALLLALAGCATGGHLRSLGKTAYNADRTKSWTIVQNSQVQSPPIQEDGSEYLITEEGAVRE